MKYYIVYNENYLCHHGIKGQKWGIRRYQNPDGTYTEEGKERYSLSQYKRDRDVYGNNAAKRIQKKMYTDETESLSGLRSKEADRIAKYRNASKIGKNIGRAVGTVGGAVGGYLAGRAITKKVLNSTTYGFNIKNNMDKEKEAMQIGSVAAAIGGMAVGNVLGQIGGKAVPMIIGGYSPSKARETKINPNIK